MCVWILKKGILMNKSNFNLSFSSNLQLHMGHIIMRIISPTWASWWILIKFIRIIWVRPIFYFFVLMAMTRHFINCKSVSFFSSGFSNPMTWIRSKKKFSLNFCPSSTKYIIRRNILFTPIIRTYWIYFF